MCKYNYQENQHEFDYNIHNFNIIIIHFIRCHSIFAVFYFKD